MKALLKSTITLFVVALLFSCSKEADIATSSACDIESFSFNVNGETVYGDINNDTVWIMLPENSFLNTLTPEITISDQATIEPASGILQDFSKTIDYFITAADGLSHKIYKVVAYAKPTFKIKSFKFPDLFIKAQIKNDKIALSVPFGTDLSDVKVAIELDDKKMKVTPDLSKPIDCSSTHSILLELNNLKKEYKIDLTIEPTETAIRSVWLTNVASPVLTSEKNIERAVNLIASLNFNTICVAVYNKSQTLFPSTVLSKILKTHPSETVYDDARWGDALKALIDKAHKKNIKVIAWFEYGFASHYQGQPSPISLLNPEWISKDIEGKQTEKNNFYWLNGIHPEVQQFMTDMIVECIRNYDIDGIQGDDRLPAMPAHAGYDDYTKSLYKKETGLEVPKNPKESNFFNWKVSKLNNYAVTLYHAVKATKSSCLVTWAPSTRGWSKENYLQDWVEWLHKDVVDYISPQLYRYESAGEAAYTGLVRADLYTTFTTEESKKKYVPGIMVKSGDYLASDNYLASCLQYNKSQGIYGCSIWFYEALQAKSRVFKAFYPAPCIYPTFN